MTTAKIIDQATPKSTGAIECDLRRSAVTSRGIPDLYWPVNIPELFAFNAELMRRGAALVRDEEETPEIIPYRLALKYVLIEAAGLYYGEIFRERMAAAGKMASVPPDWRIWPACLQKREPAQSPLIAQILGGPQPPGQKRKLFDTARLKRIWKKLKPGRGGLTVDNLRLEPVTAAKLKNAIISTQRTDLISAHAADTKTPVIYCRSWKWFRPVQEDELLAAIEEKDERLEQAVIDMIGKLFEERGQPFEDHVRHYLVRFLEQSAAGMRIHYERLLDMGPEKLPRHVWTGSGGYFWDRILRRAVMTFGGRAEGHDHGIGRGPYIFPLFTMNENWACDRFVTFTQRHAEEMTRNEPEWALLSKNGPENAGLPDRAIPFRYLELERFKKPGAQVKTIVILTPFYDRDTPRLHPLMPDIVRADWQARLIAKLKEWGYNVIFKAHPESYLLAPPAFAEMGAEISTVPFHEMLEQGDLFLFDFIYTSTFREALQTNIPMTIVDFSEVVWTETGKKLIDRRSPIVEGRYDENNRAVIDWDDLRSAIDQAPSLSNSQDYVRHYYLPEKP